MTMAFDVIDSPIQAAEPQSTRADDPSRSPRCSSAA
jgi:hypothetical protein